MSIVNINSIVYMTFYLYYIFIILAKIESDFMANRHNFKLHCSSKLDIKVRKINITNNILLLFTINIIIKRYILLLLFFYTDQRKLIQQTLPK